MKSDSVTPRLDDVQNATREELDVITNSATDNDVSDLKSPERLLIDTSSTKADKRRLYKSLIQDWLHGMCELCHKKSYLF